MNTMKCSSTGWKVLTILSMLLFMGVGGIENVWGQGKNYHTTWTLVTKSVKGKPGDKVNVKVKVNVVDGAKLYTEKTYSGDGPSPTEVTVGEKSFLRQSVANFVQVRNQC